MINLADNQSSMSLRKSLGWLLCIGGCLIFLFKLFVAFTARRKAHSKGVPTLDAVIFPPIFITVGIIFLTAPDSRLSFWWYCLMWLFGTIVSFIILWLIQKWAAQK